MNQKDSNSDTNDIEDFEGKHLPYFDYTSKNILSISAYEKKRNEEIVRVKHLSDGVKSGWIKSTRPDKTFFHEDSVIAMHKVGKSVQIKLELAGITKIKQLVFQNTTENEIKHHTKEILRIP